jgi:hypothetical protein
LQVKITEGVLTRKTWKKREAEPDRTSASSSGDPYYSSMVHALVRACGRRLLYWLGWIVDAAINQLIGLCGPRLSGQRKVAYPGAAFQATGEQIPGWKKNVVRSRLTFFCLRDLWSCIRVRFGRWILILMDV